MANSQIGAEAVFPSIQMVILNKSSTYSIGEYLQVYAEIVLSPILCAALIRWIFRESMDLRHNILPAPVQ